jgi:flagellin
MFVNTNVSALNAQRNLSDVTSRLNTSFERLSSGSRINSARDDSAGLQIADRLSSQITGLNQATANANSGIAIAQIAEGALGEITSNVQRMRQLAVQGGNTALSSADRTALGEEFEKLLTVNDGIAGRASFGDVKLLDGTGPSTGFKIHTGAFEDQVDTVTTGNGTLKGLLEKAAVNDSYGSLDLNALTSATVSTYGALGEIVAAVAATTTETFANALATIFNGVAANMTISELSSYESVTLNMSRIKDAIGESVATIWSGAMTVELQSMLSAAGITEPAAAGTELTADMRAVFQEYATDKMLSALSDVVGGAGSIRATLGAEQNGLSSTIRSNQASIVNVSDARARITDTDFATETANLTRNQIIQQASNSILAQANQLPQAALSLLR